MFTDANDSEAQTAFVPIDSALNSWADIDQPDITVGVYAGTFDETVARSFFKQATVKAIVTDKVATGMMDAMNHRIDAYFSSYVGPLLLIKENPQFKLRPIADKAISPTSASFMVPVGEYHFQQYVNAALRQLHESGKFDEIRKKWLGDLIANINL